MNLILKRLIYYITGTVLLSFGITLTILSEFGAGAFDALNSNFSRLLNISMGNAMYISILLLFIITMILKPKKIYVAGLLLTGLIGLEIDTWFKIIPDIDYHIVIRLTYFCISLVVLPLAVTFIIKSKMPLSPMDNLLIILVDKTKWNIAILKILLETSFAILALIYGLSANIGLGSLSVGTIIITLVIGPGIAFYMKYIKDID